MTEPGSAATDERVADVFIAGPVFLDIVFSGMPHAPELGTETWASAMGTCPGGVANMAVAMARLGLHVSLATAFGDDAYGDFCRESLELGEGIDLTPSVRMAGRHTPVTVSLAYDGERTMVSHGHINEHPDVGEVLPNAQSVFASLSPGEEPAWLARAKRNGAHVVVNSGWDPTGCWDLGALQCLALADIVVANEVEAMKWTRAGDAYEACRSLGKWTRAGDAYEACRSLAERVPLAVVTLGPRGAIAAGSAAGTLVEVPGIPVTVVDPTGAGDVFLAGLMAGRARGKSPQEGVTLGCVAAGLSTQRIGGSFSAPCGDEVGNWFRSHPDNADAEFRSRYGFLDELFPYNPWPRHPRRTIPTVGFRA